MNNSFKLSVIFLLLIWSFTAARADWVDDYVNRQIKQRQIPGLSIAVLRDGKVVKAAGYGLANVELKVFATDETVYEIGSISKQFAAEAVMQLVEDGKIGLDDSIDKYLLNIPEAWRKITVRQLLNHTSGLKDWTEIKEFSYRREYTPEEFINLLKAYPLGFQPNENWLYSNTNFPLLGVIVERASGKSYETFVTERIIKPLGFASIRFRHAEEVTPNRASGYVLSNGVLKNGEQYRPTLIAPSGGIAASAVDLAKWFEALLEGRLLKQTSLEQMLTPVRLNDGRMVNHGFAIFKDAFNGHRMIFHHGSTVGGFGSVVRYFPKEKITLAIVGNLEDGGWGPEYISRGVANFYIPGVYVGGLKETADPNPQNTQKLLQFLRDIAAGKDSEMLAASFRPKVPASLREQTANNLKAFKSFSFLGKEKLGAEHFLLDSNIIEAVFYKMVTSNRNVYYTFRLDKNGKVAFILTDE